MSAPRFVTARAWSIHTSIRQPCRIELVQRAAGVGARGGEVAERVEAVDVPRADLRADEVAPGVIGVPVRELVGRHVEVDGVAHLEAEARPHRGPVFRVEVARDLAVDVPVRRLVEVAADRERGAVRVRMRAEDGRAQT